MSLFDWGLTKEQEDTMPDTEMLEIRVSKYDPAQRVNGVFLGDEWTGISDVGRIFNGKKFEYAEYEQVENRYLQFIKKVCVHLGVYQMKITQTDGFGGNKKPEGAILANSDEIMQALKDCLREKCWYVLSAKNLTIYVGYDYYLHIYSLLDFQVVNDIASEEGLFAERLDAPTVSCGKLLEQ